MPSWNEEGGGPCGLTVNCRVQCNSCVVYCSVSPPTLAGVPLFPGYRFGEKLCDLQPGSPVLSPSHSVW